VLVGLSFEPTESSSLEPATKWYEMPPAHIGVWSWVVIVLVNWGAARDWQLSSIGCPGMTPPACT
jgi:hypothetical protein